eukprot:TRINITY_DN347_c1_g2_i2.p1 TRINITY_DN347_c1_g2~~TRINITY_DN347_c1_g2_i2.p1  ORF type:complete len:484 (+),score=100.06 TRINITY_DN347_c1_g2_i2:97-1452(+)
MEGSVVSPSDVESTSARSPESVARLYGFFPLTKSSVDTFSRAGFITRIIYVFLQPFSSIIMLFNALYQRKARVEVLATGLSEEKLASFFHSYWADSLLYPMDLWGLLKNFLFDTFALVVFLLAVTWKAQDGDDFSPSYWEIIGILVSSRFCLCGIASQQSSRFANVLRGKRKRGDFKVPLVLQARTESALTASSMGYDLSAQNLQKTGARSIYHNVTGKGKRFLHLQSAAWGLSLLYLLALGIPFVPLIVRLRNGDHDSSSFREWFVSIVYILYAMMFSFLLTTWFIATSRRVLQKASELNNLRYLVQSEGMLSDRLGVDDFGFQKPECVDMIISLYRHIRIRNEILSRADASAIALFSLFICGIGVVMFIRMIWGTLVDDATGYGNFSMFLSCSILIVVLLISQSFSNLSHQRLLRDATDSLLLVEMDCPFLDGCVYRCVYHWFLSFWNA